MKHKKLHLFLLVSFMGIFIWSLIEPKDLFTWVLEVFPAIIALVVLIGTYKKFPLTNLLYVLIWMHAIILVIGGHYTYAQMPLFDWFKELFGWSRNYYDRLGHFAQGFVPAMVIREIFIKNKVVKGDKWRFIIIVFMCLGISGAYELIEFLVAKITNEGSEAFLGTQGDVWDTQWDMTFALLGSFTALISLKKYHDQQLG